MIGLPPNEVALGTALAALANAKEWQRALVLLDEVSG